MNDLYSLCTRPTSPKYKKFKDGYLSLVPNEVEYFAVARRFFEMLEAEQARRDERDRAKEEKSEKAKEKDELGGFNLEGQFIGTKWKDAAEQGLAGLQILISYRCPAFSSDTITHYSGKHITKSLSKRSSAYATFLASRSPTATTLAFRMPELWSCPAGRSPSSTHVQTHSQLAQKSIVWGRDISLATLHKYTGN